MNAYEIIRIARKHAGTDTSARLCLADAVALYDAGELEYAKRRALASLSYSVGIFHPDYDLAAK